MPMYSELPKYNGWKNYPTWAVSLWLNNDPYTYGRLMELLEENEDNAQAAAAIREWVEDESPLADDASMYADILSWALSYVDWREIAENNRE